MNQVKATVIVILGSISIICATVITCKLIASAQEAAKTEAVCLCQKATIYEVAVSDSVVTVMSKYNRADLTASEMAEILR